MAAIVVGLVCSSHAYVGLIGKVPGGLPPTLTHQGNGQGVEHLIGRVAGLEFRGDHGYQADQEEAEVPCPSIGRTLAEQPREVAPQVPRGVPDDPSLASAKVLAQDEQGEQ